MDILALSNWLANKNLLNSDLKNTISNSLSKSITPTDAIDANKVNLGEIQGLTSNILGGVSDIMNVGSKFSGQQNPVLSGAGAFLNNSVKSLSPTAGLINAGVDVGVKSLGKILGKDTNYTDSGSQIVNTVADAASMFGPVGATAGIVLKSLNVFGSEKIKGTETGDLMKNTSGYNASQYEVADANTGGIGNLFGAYKKQKSKVDKNQAILNKGENVLAANKDITDSAASTSQLISLKNQRKNGIGVTRFAKNGTKLFSNEELENAKKIVKFKKGGNLIPEGALHAHKHNLDIEEVTSKGIPVVSLEEGGKVEQQLEIERNEIIFNLEVTQKLEELAKLGTDEAAVEAGKILAFEIMENTEDRTNLIKTI